MPGSCTRLQTCFGSQTYTFWGEWGRLGQCHQNPSQFPSMQEGYPVTCIPVCKGKQPAQIFSEHKENWAGLVWECAEILTSVRENRRPSLPQQQQGLPYCYQEVVPGVWRPTLQAGNQGCAFPYLQLRWDWCAGPFFVLQGNFRGGDWLSATDISGPDRMAQFLSGVLSYLWNIAPIEKKCDSDRGTHWCTDLFCPVGRAELSQRLWLRVRMIPRRVRIGSCAWFVRSGSMKHVVRRMASLKRGFHLLWCLAKCPSPHTAVFLPLSNGF